MTRDRNGPYRQGDLDGLCGIYAIINGIRLTLGDEAEAFTDTHWEELFFELLQFADETISAVAAVTCGIETQPYRELLKAAVRHMANEYDLRLKFELLLASHDRPKFARLARRLERVTRVPGVAVIVALEGHLDHWTVIRSVSDHWLQLYDSSAISRLCRTNCRMSYEPALGKAVQHIIRPSSLFRLERM